MKERTNKIGTIKKESIMENLNNIENPMETPFGYTISMLGGKWKLIILYELKVNKIMRYSQLKKALVTITHKMLSQQLKELESDGLIIRKEYPQVPPKVEYFLSDKGNSLSGIMEDICSWGCKYSNCDKEKQEQLQLQANIARSE